MQIVHPSDEWPSWLTDLCSKNGWRHATSPLVWRELVDRGGKGLYFGGLAEFEQYANHYYDAQPSTDSEKQSKIASENVDTLLSVQLEQQNAPKVEPLRVCITSATSPTAYHLAQYIATGAVYGSDQCVALHLYDQAPDSRECLEGTAMELQDLASPLLAEVCVAKSLQEAFNCVQAAFILDFPYNGVKHSTESNPASSNKEDSSKTTKPENPQVAEDSKEEKPSLAVITEESKSEEQATNPNSEVSSGLSAAGQLYYQYATSIDFCAHKDLRVLISGQYANTGAAIMAKTVTSIDKSCFIVAPSLAEQQAKAILAKRLGLNGSDIKQVAVWGRTCGDVLVDLAETRVHHFQGAVVGPDSFNLPITQCVFEPEWLANVFPAMITARHGHLEGYQENRVTLTKVIGLVRLAKHWEDGDDEVWVPVGVVCSGGEGWYGVPEGLVFSLPAQCVSGQWTVVQGINISEKTKVSYIQYHITH